MESDAKDPPPPPPPRPQLKAFPPMLLTLFFLLAGFLILTLYTTRHLSSSTARPSPAALVQSRAAPCPPSVGGGQAGLARWVQPYPPDEAGHGMSDAELFWAASLVPQITEYPFKRVPKVAFMFLTRGLLPLAPLWERFFKGNEGRYSVYVHSLPAYKGEFAAGSPFYRRQVPSQPTQWGRISMCDAERRLLANALLDLSNERFILLSESCIPLYNFSIVYRYLLRSQYSFLGAFDDPSRHGRGRYDMRMAPEVNLSQWRKGSQWFEVNRKVAISIITDTKYYSKFEQFCKPACYVDEHYFPTMLSIESPHLIENRSITWVDWSRGGPHPATFGKIDVTEAFLKRVLEGQSCLYNNQHSSLCFLFARKFAPSALEPLLQFAPTVLGLS